MKTLMMVLVVMCLWWSPLHAQENLLVAGTGESQEVVRALAETFEVLHPGITVRVPDSIGTGGGIKALQKGKTDIARTGRPLKDSEKEGLVEVQFGLTPVVFAVHPSVTGVTNLSTAQILAIYSGAITNWQEVGGPDAKIYPISRETGDSARLILENVMPGFKGVKFVSKEIYLSSEAVKAVREHEFTIGYFSATSVHGNNLKLVKIDGKNPQPDQAGTIDYPYFCPFYFVTKGAPSPLARQFIDFAFSAEGRKILLANGALPVK